jgi:hypothetical protein
MKRKLRIICGNALLANETLLRFLLGVFRVSPFLQLLANPDRKDASNPSTHGAARGQSSP